MAKVSIIIACYNGEKYLREAIESLLSQTEENIEIIVVDDGSADKTAEIIKSFQSTNEKIKYFYQKNSGSPASPRNKGIKEASGEYVGFCDQDDIYYREKLERQIRAYEECDNKSEVGLIISSAVLIDESGNIIGHNIKPFQGFMDKKSAHELLLKGDFITACSVLVPKRVLDEVGRLDESLKGVDDYDLWLRVTEKYSMLTIKESLCAWRQSALSLSADKTKQYIETEKIFKKLNDKTEEICVGHGRNLMRIFICHMLDRNLFEANNIYNQIRTYSISKKIRVILFTYRLNQKLCFMMIRLLFKTGFISL